MDDVVEYYYALASPWAYIGNAKLETIVEAAGKKLDPIIIDYDQMFEASGTLPLPKRPPLRKAYRLIELARWSKKREVPLNPEPPLYTGETEEPDELLGALMVTALKMNGGNSLSFAHAISRALWTEGRFPFTRSELESIATAEGLDYQNLIKNAESEETKQTYINQTKQAVDRGVFGMPFYIYRQEPFWGQDRLEMLEEALNRVG